MGNHGQRRVMVPRVVALALLLLGGCPTVDLGDTPDDIIKCNPAGGADYFSANIYPMYLKADDTATGCTQAAGCHNEGGGTPLNLRIGARRDDAFNFKQAQEFLDCDDPAMSRLLTRPLSEIDAHGGGDIYTMSDAEVQVFLDWFL
ncbi:MAG: hypothetical protein ABI867_26845 [Kofleriaceae bacterium]